MSAIILGNPYSESAISLGSLVVPSTPINTIDAATSFGSIVLGQDLMQVNTLNPGQLIGLAAGGVTVHSLLEGLTADDHTQYHNDSRADIWFNSKEVTYVPSGMNVIYGTLDSGTYTDLASLGGTDVVISEASGVNAIEVNINYSSVTQPLTNVLIYGNYNGGSGHQVGVEIYNNNTTNWDQIGIMAHSTIKQWYEFSIFNYTVYVNSGTVTIRFRHLQSGNPVHDLILDFVV
jgi:hypothetical protein